MYETTSMLEAFAPILTDSLLIINFHCHDQTPVLENDRVRHSM